MLWTTSGTQGIMSSIGKRKAHASLLSGSEYRASANGRFSYERKVVTNQPGQLKPWCL